MEIFGKKLVEGEYSIEAKDFSLKAEVRRTDFGWMLDGWLRGKVGRIEVFRTKAPKRAFLNNWQSWGPCRMVDLEQFQVSGVDKDWRYAVSLVPELLERTLVSDYFVAEEGKLYGFLTSRLAHPFFAFEGQDLVAYLEYFDTFFEEYVPLETFVLMENPDNYGLLTRYA